MIQKEPFSNEIGGVYDPWSKGNSNRRNTLATLFSRLQVNPTSLCWEYLGLLDRDGYGVIKLHNINTKRVHRLIYSIFVGTLQDMLVIDHICRNRKCCNPDHLRQVNYQQNAIENSISVAAKNKVKTKCLNGHLLVEENLYVYNNGRCRVCKICNIKNRIPDNIEYQKAYRIKNKEKISETRKRKRMETISRTH